MLKPKLMRAARALAGWEQSDLAHASGLSIATVRKIEQGAVGIRKKTEGKIIAAFECAGIQLIAEDRGGGAGVRYKEREMNEQMRKYLDLRNKIKGWFIYNLGRKDDEDLGDMVDEVAFEYMMKLGDPASLNETLNRWDLSELPPQLVKDLETLGEMENDIGAEQDARLFDDDENDFDDDENDEDE
jgi:transcriptional regulator with XRE-family HTH domain